jgi:hypothetical protein
MKKRLKPLAALAPAALLAAFLAGAALVPDGSLPYVFCGFVRGAAFAMAAGDLIRNLKR